MNNAYAHLADVLDEIDQYLQNREDVEDRPSGEGVRPNEEMNLLTALRYARGAVESARPEDGGITQALVQMARENAIEECARLFDGLTFGHYAHPSPQIRALKESSAAGETPK